ncbi:MAG: KTSC domain-containing protein [Candidatus Thorarchaeota archaeon]|jgi:hypothetical protein
MKIIHTILTPKSSHIHSVMWTEKGLVIIFRDADLSTYLYPGVSEMEFHRLHSARSIGGYFHSNIRGKYAYQRIYVNDN